jgi:predicted transposase/invertase (TIGR01784 family)
MKQVAPLRYDVIFKKAFSQPDIFTALVKDFTGLELEIDEVENDKSFYPAVADVANRFDLFAEDKKNRVIVEVQHAHYPDTYERFLYYQLSAMVESIKSASNYKFPKTVITLVFFTEKKTPSPNSSILFHKFNVMEDFKGTKFNLFGREHQMLFIYTSSYGHGDLPEEIEEWMKAIDNSLTGTIYEEDYTNPKIHRLFELIEMDNLSPEENARLKDDYYPEKILIEAAQAQAQVEEAQAKIAQLKAQTQVEIVKAQAKAQAEATRNLKALGTLTDEQIANAIGLSLEEVKAL